MPTPGGEAFPRHERSSAVLKDGRAALQPDRPRFLPDAAPGELAQFLPPLPPVQLSLIGASGLTGFARSDGSATPDAPASLCVMANTQFFETQAWGTKFVYVIDRSGSMAEHDALGAAKRELLASVAKLPSTAQFQVILYNLEPERMPTGIDRSRLLVASDTNKKALERFLASIAADKAAEHVPALKLALSLGPDVILFLTDADDMTVRDVRDLTAFNKDRVRIHTIEFGPGPNSDPKNPLREVSDLNGGTYRYIDVTKLHSTAQADE